MILLVFIRVFVHQMTKMDQSVTVLKRVILVNVVINVSEDI
jgi:hypothetical protein